MANDITQLGPPVKMCRVDIGGSIVTAAIHEQGDHVVMPIAAELRGGGFFQAMIVCDRKTFDRALNIAREKGLTAVRMADLAEKFLGHRPLLTIEERPLLPR